MVSCIEVVVSSLEVVVSCIEVVVSSLEVFVSSLEVVVSSTEDVVGGGERIVIVGSYGECVDIVRGGDTSDESLSIPSPNLKRIISIRDFFI